MAKQKRGKRYTQEEKDEVIAFVQEINNERGRGGVSSASKKFGVSQLTVSNWVKKAGGASTSSTPKATKSAAKSTSSAGGNRSTYRRLADLDEEIATKRQELAQLEKEFSKLKSKI